MAFPPDPEISEECAMAESGKPRVVGFNHVALEVGDIEEALAFYGRLFEFELRGKSDDHGLHRSGRPVPRASEGPQAATRRRPPFRSRGRRQGGGRAARWPRPASRRCPARSSISSIPGATASRSSATTTSSSPRPRTCCAAWGWRIWPRTRARSRSWPRRAWRSSRGRPASACRSTDRRRQIAGANCRSIASSPGKEITFGHLEK